MKGDSSEKDLETDMIDVGSDLSTPGLCKPYKILFYFLVLSNPKSFSHTVFKRECCLKEERRLQKEPANSAKVGFFPTSLSGLTSYWPAFQTQGLTTFEKIAVLTWEDLEEIGITKLGHQKKLILAIERLRRALSKRNEDQAVGTDSLTRNRQSQQHLLSSPSHLVTQPLTIAEEQEATMTGNLADLTPPPPPGFQDPPHVVRKASLDFSPPTIINPSSPDPRRIGHHRHHFSTSFLTDIGRLGSNVASGISDIGGEGSTKSDPLPRMGACEGEGEVEVEGGIAEEEKNSKGHQRGTQQACAESLLSVRQRHRNAAAAAITIP
ncbi:Caskin-1, partial [Taenia solium]